MTARCRARPSIIRRRWSAPAGPRWTRRPRPPAARSAARRARTRAARRRRPCRAGATTGPSAAARAASCATGSPCPRAGARRCGSQSRAGQGPGRGRQRTHGGVARSGRGAGAKVAAREALSKWSRVTLPGDTLLQDAIDWGKQNLADLTQTASDLQIRWTNQGKQYPAPLGTIANARWFGAGYPDYPWLFATDGEYTNFAAVALGQFEVAKDHLRALRDISDILNDRSGIVVHEAVSDGSIWYGHDSQSAAGTNDFNTDETVKFPSAVALIWRWT